MNATLVSVMTPCFNSADTLPRALASLVAQTHRDWEALVIDDGSTDHPEAIIRRFEDSRIRYFRFPENRGRGAARQLALENMRGDFLTMLDADDWLLPDKLARQIRILQEHPEISMVSCPIYLMDSDGALMGVPRSHRQTTDLSIHGALRAPRSLPLAHAPIMVRAELVRERHYDSNLRFSEDLDFFLPILLQHPFAIMATPLYVYSFGDYRSRAKIRMHLQAHRHIFKKFMKTHPRSALWRMFLTYPKTWLSMILSTLPWKAWFRYRHISRVSENETAAYWEADNLISESIQKTK
jgi:glycosyltransferase involved in cell wall biosynthesis